MRKHVPTTQEKLAAVLTASIPEWRGFKVTWRHDAIYPARGIWRQKRMDVCCWSASGYNDNGHVLLHVDCWETMTECVKAGKVGYDEKNNYVYPVKEL